MPEQNSTPNSVTDPKRRRYLMEKISQLQEYVKKNGGDPSYFSTDGSQLSDSVYIKTQKLVQQHLKDNPQLSDEAPELYGRSSTGQKVYTDQLRELHRQQLAEQHQQVVKEVPPANNIVPRAGDSYTKAALRSFFGAKDAYDYSTPKDGGFEWRPASSPKEAMQRMAGDGRDLSRGNALFEKVKKKAEKK